jgi:type IV pilus assembly protein PilX
MTPRHQRGSVLIVTLILLLVVSALAISSVRDSALEYQAMTRNLEQQRLFNAAEAGLREAERRIAKAAFPLQPCGAPPCLQGLATNYAVDFSLATSYPGTFGPAPTAASVRWYIRLIPATGQQPVEAAYGEAARALGTLYYEVSSQAFFPHLAPSNLNGSCALAVVCLRAVVARTYLEGQP